MYKFGVNLTKNDFFIENMLSDQKSNFKRKHSEFYLNLVDDSYIILAMPFYNINYLTKMEAAALVKIPEQN